MPRADDLRRSGRRRCGFAVCAGLSAVLLGCSSRAAAPELEFDEPIEVGRVQDERIDEASGLALSLRAEETVFWLHNDGAQADVFTIDSAGAVLARWRVRGAENRCGAKRIDWESMATYSHGGVSYLVFADIGDNFKRRTCLQLHIAREPDPNADAREIRVERTVRFQYPGGGLYDAEAIAVDATGAEPYAVVLTKSAKTRVFKILLTDGEEVQVARRLAELPLAQVTAAEISPDGRYLAVANYGRRAYVLTLAVGVEGSLEGEWLLVRAPRRRQGETLAWDRTGSLYLNSEGVGEPLWKVAAR